MLFVCSCSPKFAAAVYAIILLHSMRATQVASGFAFAVPRVGEGTPQGY